MLNDRDHTPLIKGGSHSGDPETDARQFWVGCSDAPGELFDLATSTGALFHSNPGNLAQLSDVSFLASLKMAIDTYNVGEIIVCGHYGCRSVEAAASGSREEIIGDWLTPVRALAGKNHRSIGRRDGPSPEADTLTELNVVEQALNVSRTSIVQDAWASGRQLTIVGMIFDPANGSLSRIGEPITFAFGSDVK